MTYTPDASIGATGSPIPADATFIGAADPSGKLQGLAVKNALAGATANDPSLVATLSPMSGIPAITPKGNNKATSAKTVNVASVVVAAHQTIIVCFGSGNWAASSWSVSCSDGTNTYVLDQSAVQGTTAYSAIFRAANAAAGTYTITVTISGTNSANTTVQMEVYVVDGILLPASALDQSATGTNAGSTAASTSTVYPQGPNEIAFAALAAAAAETSITAGGSWTADYTNNDSTLSFGSFSQILAAQAGISGSATLASSAAWSMALCTYRTPAENIEGSVEIQVQGSPLVPAATGIPKVGIVGNSGTSLDGSTAGVVDENLKLINNSAISTAATGVQKVGVVGNAGGAVDGATAASVPANAVQQGLRGATAAPTDVTDGQLVAPMADDWGRQVTVLNTVRDLVGSVQLNSSSSSLVSFIAAGGSGVFNDIVSLICTNESSTATIVSLSDGTTTYKFALAANGGIVINFPTPLPATSSNTAWQVSNSAAVAVDYVAVYAKNK